MTRKRRPTFAVMDLRHHDESVAVVVTSEQSEGLAALLPPTVRVVATGVVYRLYAVPDSSDSASHDYLDLRGCPLIATHFFDSRAEAERWIRRHVALRAAETRGVQ